MWTIAAINKKFDGPLGSYNGLTDVHLAHYFSRPFRRSHLKSANLITPDGVIIPERRVKVETLQYEKKKKLCDILANAVVQNAVHEEGRWNKKLCSYLENISKMNIVEKIKKLSKKKQCKVSSDVLMKNSDLNQLIHGYDYFETSKYHLGQNLATFPHSAPSGCFYFPDSSLAKPHTSKQRCLSAKEHSPYVIPLLMSKSFKQQRENEIPLSGIHSSKKKRRKRRRRSTSDGITKNSDLKLSSGGAFRKMPSTEQKAGSNHCKLTLYYHGPFLTTSSHMHVIQDIIIKQQHCGGTPVVVYKGNIAANESLTFNALDHEGFSFSIIVFLDGIRDLKLSTCCVFRYLPGKRLGGSNGSFSLKSIEGGKPCLKCQYYATVPHDIDAVYWKKNCRRMLNKSELQTKVLLPVDLENMDEKTKDNQNMQPIMLHNYQVTTESNEDENSVKSVESFINPDVDSEEISDASDLNNTDITNRSVNDERQIEEINSVEEEIKGVDELSYNSESSIASIKQSAQELTGKKKFREIAINSGSSSEDEFGQQHVVLASVHGSPN